MKLASNFASLISQIRDYKSVLFTIGGSLAYARENYEEMVGEGITSWSDFLAQPEIGLTVREANGLIKLHDWVNETGVNIKDVNLSSAKFAANKGLDINGVEDDINMLSLKDFKERHYDVSKGEDNAPRTYTYLLMRKCNETNSLSRVYDEEAEKLLETIKDRIDE